MKVTLLMVMSVDGKTTKWGQPNIYTWTSREDQKHFFSVIEKSKVIVMGRKTYDQSKSIMRISQKQRRIILTSEPDSFKDLSIYKQLEFTNIAPKILLRNLEEEGCSEVLLVGGEHINTSFFQSKLIDEIFITIEPAIFGAGNGLTTIKNLDLKLRLKSVKKINQRGTLLLNYLVM